MLQKDNIPILIGQVLFSNILKIDVLVYNRRNHKKKNTMKKHRQEVSTAPNGLRIEYTNKSTEFIPTDLNDDNDNEASKVIFFGEHIREAIKIWKEYFKK